MSTARELLEALVAIDTTSSRSNVPIADFLEPQLIRLGFSVRRMAWRDDSGVDKVNLVARRGPDGPGGLALVGHTDCVPFDPAWTEALKPVESGGELSGRGSADTKAFIAAALVAADHARSQVHPLHLVFTADEEVGCLGAKRLAAEDVLHPRHAIVGEPTQLTPVRAHKGYCLAQIEVTGVEGHSAYPEVGSSAILAAGRLLGEVERIGRELSREVAPLFSPPHTTFNVGTIEGGKARNIIPGRCAFPLEWRPIPGQDVRRVLERVEAAGRAIEASEAGRLRVAVRVTRLDPGVSTAPDAEIVRFLEDESGRAAGTIPFGTELPQLTALGAQGCVFGPGDIRNAHRTGEHVPLAELDRAVTILARAVDRFC